MPRVRLSAAWLGPATLVYLGIPVVLFVGGWLRFVVAWATFAAAAGAVGFHLWRWARRSPDGAAEPSARSVSLGTFVAILLVAAAWVGVSGVGGYGTQSWDSQFQQSVLRDLSFKPWPVAYQAEGHTIAMVYSLQSYLPAAVVGGWFGWRAANHAWALWVFLGLALSLLWYVKVIGRGVALPLLLFAVWSGLDAVGLAMNSTFSPQGPDFYNPEWWARYFQYSANATLLFYVPHYAVPSWLTALMLVDDSPALRQASSYILLMALAFLWSPFAFLGAAPLAVVVLVRSRARTLLHPLNVLGAVLFSVGFVYYLAKITGTELPGHRMPTGLSYLAVEPYGFRRTVNYLFLHPTFVLLEFGIMALVVAMIGRRSSQGWYRGHFKWCYLASCGFLTLLPALRMGEFNDVVMRASIAGLLMVLLGTVWSLLDASVSRKHRLAVAMLVVGGLLVPWQEWRRHKPSLGSLGHHVAIRPLEEVPDMNGLFLIVHTTGFYDQFMGATDTVFFRYLADDLDPLTDAGRRP